MSTLTSGFNKYKSKLQNSKGIKGGWDIPLILMMLPTIVLLAVVSIYPFMWLLKYVFYDYNGFKTYFIGLDNFKRVFTNDPIYWKSVVHTFEYAFLKLLFTMPISLMVAVVLNHHLKGKNLFRIIFFIPTVISAAVYSLIFYFIYSPYNGILNNMLMEWGWITAPIDWLGSSAIAMSSVVIVAIWGGFGNYMILFLAGLQSISQEVYESADIDGASKVQSFFQITIPMLGPILKVVLLLAITTALKDYQSIMVLTGGGPLDRTQVMFLYVYQLMFGNENSAAGQLQIGYGATVGLVSSIIIGIATAVFLKLSKKLDNIY
ncbi:MAG: sugar transporter permease [Clostridia bacterium]|jgi:raffinose/stachyose/melibiose transport system permease protein|nr:sugar transporter permease [Clostridia bacterium]